MSTFLPSLICQRYHMHSSSVSRVGSSRLPDMISGWAWDEAAARWSAFGQSSSFPFILFPLRQYSPPPFLDSDILRLFPAFLTSLSSDAAFSDRAWTRLFRSGLDVTERKGTAMKHLCILIVSPFSLFFCLFHQFTAFLRSCFRRLTVSEAQWTAFGHSLLESYDSIFLSKSILFFFISCFYTIFLLFCFPLFSSFSIFLFSQPSLMPVFPRTAAQLLGW